jgi:hypothetical protein
MKKYVKSPSPDSHHYQYSLACSLNPEDNGGEQIVLDVDVFNNGEENYCNVHLEGQCYGAHSTRFTMCINPEEIAKACQKMVKIIREGDKSC